MKKLFFSLIQVFDDPENDFRGNISAVIMLDSPLQDGEMQTIAADLNQPATTFLWPGSEKNTFNVRWFAPDAEIGLCGHGSMAALAFLGLQEGNIRLKYREGIVNGSRNGQTFSMTIHPIAITGTVEITDILKEGLGIPVLAHYSTENKNIVLVESEEKLQNMKPDFARLRQSEIFGYAVTAKGDNVDFVSRTLVPHVRQLEDHATGSSHAALVPFWAQRLGKKKMTAHQLSPRRGLFQCEYRESEVVLTGKHSILARGEFFF